MPGVPGNARPQKMYITKLSPDNRRIRMTSEDEPKLTVPVRVHDHVSVSGSSVSLRPVFRRLQLQEGSQGEGKERGLRVSVLTIVLVYVGPHGTQANPSQYWAVLRLGYHVACGRLRACVARLMSTCSWRSSDSLLGLMWSGNETVLR